jgi:hypothetical protein
MAVLDATKGVGLEVNGEKSKYIFKSHCQTAGPNHYTKVVTNSLKMMQNANIWE